MPCLLLSLKFGCWAPGRAVELLSLNISISAPLNPARKPLSWLARDLEAEPPAGAAEGGSIAGKARFCSSLGCLLAIIQVLT